MVEKWVLIEGTYHKLSPAGKKFGMAGLECRLGNVYRVAEKPTTDPPPEDQKCKRCAKALRSKEM